MKKKFALTLVLVFAALCYTVFMGSFGSVKAAGKEGPGRNMLAANETGRSHRVRQFPDDGKINHCIFMHKEPACRQD
ncbi:MAG: hypothetical protein M1508_02125 [Nitrospirae bacterium]|nr:hypothetical protein [Nitrospirota bacterium]MCL5421954.1 hypothetical protein [Nitrospirota bacterium]